VRPPWVRPEGTLFGKLLALIGLSLLIAQAVVFFLIYALPPPIPDFYQVNEVAQALQGEPQTYVNRQPLELRTSATPPEPGLPLRVDGAIRDQLARTLHVSPDRVVVGGHRGLFADRRAAQIMRQRVARQGGAPEDPLLVKPFEVGVRQDDGSWRLVRPATGFGPTPWQQRSVLWFVLTTLVMAPVAYEFARRLSAPFRLFAEAAERLGRDPGTQPLALKGAAEIDVAVRAFNNMQERLRRYVADRTAMVGAIAHDMRTPLTRLRFRVESAPDELRAKMIADIDQMEEMIAAALTFVRDASREGERTPLELSSLLESLCDEMAETGADTQVERGDKVVLNGDPLALRRLFTNVLDNAVKFGRRARTRVFQQSGSAVVEIEDDGPGIPLEDYERVFEPFYRREPSRSRQTGGIGLGLAVVRSVARGHGGDVSLFNRAGGGLTVRVHLPI